MNKRNGAVWNTGVDYINIKETLDNGVDIKSTDAEFIAEVVKCPETVTCKREIWRGSVDKSWWVAATVVEMVAVWWRTLCRGGGGGV